MADVTFIKEVRGVNTYKKVVDTEFSELITPVAVIPTPTVTVADFFSYYDQLFYDIPVSGSVNSHPYLVQRSQQYIGAGVIDQEKQALIEEINSLREQLVQLGATYLNISTLS